MELEQLKRFERYLSSHLPLELRWKDESWFQRMLGTLVRPFNSLYLTRYVSTFAPYVYYPSRVQYEKSPDSSLLSLAHEYVHLQDTHTSPLWFRLSYLAPQVFALPLILVGVVLAGYFGWWATPCFVFANLCLLPWPSPWRVHWEQRGYLMTLAVVYWMTGTISPATRLKVKLNFVGWPYYRMSWSEDDILGWVKQAEAQIYSGELENAPLYGDVFRFLSEEGLLVPPPTG